MRKITYSLFIIIIFITGCKKMVEVDAPVTSTNAANVFTNDVTAAAVLTGIYARMSLSPITSGGIASMSLFTGLSSDELVLYNGITDPSVTFDRYYKNALSTTPALGADFWTNIYPLIFVANSAIEGLLSSTTLTPVVKQQLLGEAKFMRAFFYFYLVNLYGDVPLVLVTDYTHNSSLTRSSKFEVYDQILSDLNDAQSLLSLNYLNGDALIETTERLRPTKWAAEALLARVYLFIGDYKNSEAHSTYVINNSRLFFLDDLNNVFKKNSSEAIWQLQPVVTGINTQDARMFIIPSSGPSTGNPVYLSNNILNAFEIGDNRKRRWIDSVVANSTTYYYPYKYKSATNGAAVTEYLMVLRLGEQYLIRAEARAQQNNISGSQADLNMIRNRANLANTSTSDKIQLLSEIRHERQVELFTEWGHRWFDLKRTNSVDNVMSIVTPQKGGSWNTSYQLYPIPQVEIQRNPNLVQNGGY